MKIVCDTNVLISGILFGGNARQILDLATRGAVTNAISADILNEAQGVLLRPKFGLSTSQVLGILELFRDTFETVIPDCPVAAITDDPDDNRILEAALAAKADAIVSGDKHLLDLGTWNGIPILSLADFLRCFK
jgi:putative PIN family toxin of toxin-antitoxin system